MPRRDLSIGSQLEPVEAVGRDRQQIRQFADGWKRRAAQHFDRHTAFERGQVEFNWLSRTRQIGNAQDGVCAILAKVRQYLAVAGLEKLTRAAPERLAGLSHGEHALRPTQQRTRIAQLSLDV